jgi:hypothetical protein
MTRWTGFPIYDCHPQDADRETLASPIGYAMTALGALRHIRRCLKGCAGASAVSGVIFDARDDVGQLGLRSGCSAWFARFEPDAA